MHKHQYGFRKEHSTELAVLELRDRLIECLDNGEIQVSIFLDLSKAFDTLDHSILIEKLKLYGIQNTELKLMTNYLTNRKQYVDIEGTKSKMLHIKTGVPQGSVLGLLLFIIYITCMKKPTFDLLLFSQNIANLGTNFVIENVLGIRYTRFSIMGDINVMGHQIWSTARKKLVFF